MGKRRECGIYVCICWKFKRHCRLSEAYGRENRDVYKRQYQERDEQYKMVLVCNRIAVWFSICSILMCLPDRYIDHNRYIRYWNSSCFCTCNRSFISVLQTLQRERYIKSKCKRHGRRKISTASKVAAVCVDMAAIFITCLLYTSRNS